MPDLIFCRPTDLTMTLGVHKKSYVMFGIALFLNNLLQYNEEFSNTDGFKIL